MTKLCPAEAALDPTKKAALLRDLMAERRRQGRARTPPHRPGWNTTRRPLSTPPVADGGA